MLFNVGQSHYYKIKTKKVAIKLLPSLGNLPRINNVFYELISNGCVLGNVRSPLSKASDLCSFSSVPCKYYNNHRSLGSTFSNLPVRIKNCATFLPPVTILRDREGRFLAADQADDQVSSFSLSLSLSPSSKLY